jgi:hypothetical protein
MKIADGCVALVVCLLSISGCKGDGCPKGGYKDPQARFCLALPAGYEVTEQKGAGYPSVKIAKGNSNATIAIAPPDQYDNQIGVVDSEVSNKNAQVVERADIADGRGKFVHLKTAATQMEQATSVVKGPKNVLQCQASWFSSSPQPDLVAICKGLSAPK